MSAPPESIAAQLGTGTDTFALSFAGLGWNWWESLGNVVRDRHDLRQTAARWEAVVQATLRRPEFRSTGLSVGFEPVQWIDEPSTAPPAGALLGSATSIVGCLFTQMLAYRSLWSDGLAGAVAAGTLVGLAGHSVGVLAACAVAEMPDGLVNDDRVAEYLKLAVLIGHAASSDPHSVGPAALQSAFDGRPDAPVPMLAVSHVRGDRLQHLISLDHKAVDNSTVGVALHHGATRAVVSGTVSDLARFRERLNREPGIVSEPLLVDIPAHSVILDGLVNRIAHDATRTGLHLDAAQFRFPVWSGSGLKPFNGECTYDVVADILSQPLRWDGATRALVEAGAGWIVDVGPSDGIARLTMGALRGTGARVVAAGSVRGRRQLFAADAEIAPAMNYSTFQPRLVTLPSGVVRVENHFTRATGRSPMILPGMTPTTVDAPIVAAAANAGFLAELAGGGQVNAPIFNERMRELNELLDHGQEIVFNALHLDPYLWGLHLGREKLVQRARAAGAPICGVTVSAGIPELDDAVALLDELASLGIWLNAFKPGTVEQIRQVVAIAAAANHHTVFVHVEGGTAGGHHSWEDLEDLLLSTYHLLRGQPNVVLCVGGGVGTPERAAELLTGSWSLRHGTVAMPVDGLLLGTVTMACAEATATLAVKQLLRDAVGTDGFVRPAEIRGGVTSGRSGLNADIHFLDNSAARCAALLDSVSGDATAVNDRREEIISALDGTAKPYFGDVDGMTYHQLLQRFVELVALGRSGRYEDGVWLDVSHRDRFLALLQRAEGRLNSVEHGQIDSLFNDRSSVDNPRVALGRLVENYPHAAVVQIHPADAMFLIEVCRWPGKPVPFVPVIDVDVRRWYQSDSLWQAQHESYDADAVLVIPGPVAIIGIDRIDEPVADLLGTFESHLVALLSTEGAAGAAPVSRLRRNEPTVDVFNGPVAVLAGAPTVLRSGRHVPNPLLRLAPLTTWRCRSNAEGVLSRSDLAIEGVHEREHVSLVADENDVVVDVAIPSLAHSATHLALRFRTEQLNGVDAVSVDQPAWIKAMRQMLETTLLRGVAVPPVLGGNAVIDVELDVDTLACHASSVGGDRMATLLDAWLGVAWPAVFAALGAPELLPGLLDLMHLEHRVRGMAPTEGPVTVTASVVEVSPHDLGCQVETSATIERNGDVLAMLGSTFLIRGLDAPDGLTGTSDGHHIDSHDRPRKVVAQATVTAPTCMDSFAAVTGDHNPIHRSVVMARLAGFEQPIVHGAWTSAVAQRVLIEGLGVRSDRLVEWSARFLSPVDLGAELTVVAARSGLRDGATLFTVEVTMASVDGPVPVMAATCEVAPPRTAYLFPGQGIQHTGMGMEGFERSPAARRVWERADACTRNRLGFSILHIVRNNPDQLATPSELYRHPAGVLHLTQFTQVAMATLAAAQIAELRESGAFVPNAVTAGHSVGEYNSLAAAAEVLPLEAVVELVFQRGLAMHHLVPRDEFGASNYRLGVVRPHEVGMEHSHLEQLVEELRDRTGDPLEIVNFNLRGKQYAVAGTIRSLAQLEKELSVTASRSGKPAFLLVPGIDVPFHSSVLRGGVADFRLHLDRCLSQEIDPDLLVGRYVPNLVPRAFTLSKESVTEIAEYTGASSLIAILDDWTTWSGRPSRLAREILVELLAWQFASPVRWIETQDLLLTPIESGGLGIERIVEVGVGAAPTVANLARGTIALPEHLGLRPEVLNLEAEWGLVVGDDEPFVAAPDESDDTDDPGPRDEADPAADAVPVSGLSSSAGGPPRAGSTIAPHPLEIAEALRALLAFRCNVRTDQLADTDSIDDLVDGVSSRRNQLLMDVGAEFGISGVDGAQALGVTALATEVAARAPRYRAPGPVLRVAIDSAVVATLGPLGGRARDVASRVDGHWALPSGWAERIGLAIAVDGRAGDSVRGGPLGRLQPIPGSIDELVDATVLLVGAELGVVVAPAETAASGTVDAAAVADLESRLAGPDGLLAETARDLLARTGASTRRVLSNEADDERVEIRLAELEAEHGVDRAASVQSVFDGLRHVEFSSWWATARHDLVRLHHDSLLGIVLAEELDQTATRLRRCAVDPVVRSTAAHLADRATRRGDMVSARRFQGIAVGNSAIESARHPALTTDVALVTGASPGGIAYDMVRRLLEAGATVVCTTSSATPKRLADYRELYCSSAAPGAVLHVVPANLASFRDIDALVRFVIDELELRPTLLLPFAAGSVSGDMSDAGPSAEITMRTLVWGVERLMGAMVERMDRLGTGGLRLHVVLPASPNHGTFGGDGAYGEAKAALDAIAEKWSSEQQRWGQHVSLVAALIGWVRGTGLMGTNDDLAPIIEERLGVRTFSTSEMADLLLEACDESTRERAALAPVRLSLDGGLAGHDVAAVLRSLSDQRSAGEVVDADADTDDVDRGGRVDAMTAGSTIAAMPSPPRALTMGDPAPVAPTLLLDDLVVVVGSGEVGPWGTSASRFDLEVNGELSAASVLELAWWCGLVRWESGGASSTWVDVSSDEPVAEHEIADRYDAVVREHCGIRTFDVDGPLDPDGVTMLAEVFLDTDLSIPVETIEAARELAAVDPGVIRIEQTPAGALMVVRPAGTSIRVARRSRLSRRVGAQLPSGFDPTRWGIPAEMAATVDRVSLWNLIGTVEAFIDAGIEPEELLARLHPTRVGNTQGTGMGGMNSLRSMYAGAVLDRDRPNDLLQESLANVVAAYVVQSYVGGYGPNIHPVAACATGAVSIEAGADAIRLGKADVIVAGGWDDISMEGVVGFSNMAATASTDDMLASGLAPDQFSRPNDRRRAGFVESQGGGTILLARASTAAELGLPVRGVVVFACTYSDGIQTSIPAPGLGAVACVTGGDSSPLARALAAHGLNADDIAVVSKHDTSTAANDPNESAIHDRIAIELGRTPGNPMLTVSQKSVTGHAKGGAAIWQAIGLLQTLETGHVPGNRNLESLSETHRDHHHLTYGHRHIIAGEKFRAGLLTSLGFGHASGVVCLANRSVFLAALDASQHPDAATYRERASKRDLDGRRRRLSAMYGGDPMFRKRSDRRLDGADGTPERRVAEMSMLSDAATRLGPDGLYVGQQYMPSTGPVQADLGSGSAR